MDFPQPRVGSTAEIGTSAASRRWGTMFFVTFASGTCGAWLTVGPNTFPYTKSVPYLKCPIRIPTFIPCSIVQHFGAEARPFSSHVRLQLYCSILRITAWCSLYI
jgi:hypothetical protein